MTAWPGSLEDAQQRYAEGMRLQQAGHLAEAQQSLSQAHDLAPANQRIAIALAKLDAILGQKDAAIALFRQVQIAHPQDADNAINLAVALADNGALNEALPFAAKAVTLAPRSPAAHHLRGKLLAEMSLPDDAQVDYQTALALAPDDPQTLYDDALLCKSTGKIPEEISLLRRLIKLSPATGNLHFLLGRALATAGDQVEALAETREAVRLEPDNRAALYDLSRSLRQTNPAEAAQYAARFKALKLSDEETNTLRDQGNRGVKAMQERDWPTAISTFQAALATCAGCTLEATLEKDLGLAQCQAGDTSAGAASLRRSLALDPNDLDVLKALEIATRTTPGQAK